MTENEAIKGLETLKYQCKHNGECGTCNVCCSAIPLAIQAIEEIKQYRAIGTVEELEAMKKGTLSAMELVDIWCVLEDLKKYSAIGTIEEFKALKEKSVAKKPFQPFGTHSYKCSNCWKFVVHEVDDNCDLSSLAEWCPYCGKKIKVAPYQPKGE